MTPRMPDPWTKAGRALLAARPIETETTSGRTLRSPDKVLRKAVLAIEAEARTQGHTEGYLSRVQDEEAASPDSEALRAALERLITHAEAAGECPYPQSGKDACDHRLNLVQEVAVARAALTGLP
jgi:membrane-bound ClpP family serine protease